MGKEKPGFLSPKAVSNRIKSKGLQKLRWYCQMCQKQCRDENGFKCHMTSESHQRQLLIFSERPHEFLGTFSTEFKLAFLDILKRSFGTKRVSANQVYKEYINDKHHVHMNATRWTTLTGFICWLGRTGICNVDETEKGWYLQYIDRDPETLRKQEALAKKDKMKKDDEERLAEFIKQQVEKGSPIAEPEYTELKRENEDEKIKIEISKPIIKAPEESEKVQPTNVLEEVGQSSSSTKRKSHSSKPDLKRKNALEEIMETELRQKHVPKITRRENWLHKGIVVKIISKSIEKFHKRKAVVIDIEDTFTAVVETLDTKTVLKLDQSHIETVIPNIGRPVLILNGIWRGCSATLLSVEQDKFSCTLQLQSGPNTGKAVDGIEYQDVSKIHNEKS